MTSRPCVRPAHRSAMSSRRRRSTPPPPPVACLPSTPLTTPPHRGGQRCYREAEGWGRGEERQRVEKQWAGRSGRERKNKKMSAASKLRSEEEGWSTNRSKRGGQDKA